MSTITKEQAKPPQCIQCWQQDYDPVEDKEQYDMFGLGMVAMDALLASLEAEAVAYMIGGHYLMHAQDPKVDNYTSAVPLYTAPPAASADEDLLHMAASAIEDLLSNKDRSGAGVWSDIPGKLRRAAMINGVKS